MDIITSIINCKIKPNEPKVMRGVERKLGLDDNSTCYTPIDDFFSAPIGFIFFFLYVHKE
jgi:hypothetical protein